jgi:hypothetical protein
MGNAHAGSLRLRRHQYTNPMSISYKINKHNNDKIKTFSNINTTIVESAEPECKVSTHRHDQRALQQYKDQRRLY